ncbi:hypothetical protein [Ureibacillus sp. GCM10028918]|uniref:hypothetical protein n=1 Tax=Ureibacillus sp. GCM10028918 TaxID=3273429 RepID=UPI0036068658
MDINKIKKQADDANKKSKELETLRLLTLDKYKIFNAIYTALFIQIESAVIKKKNELTSQFKEYFEKNGFEITTKVNRTIARYKDLTILLEDENANENIDESVISLRISSENLVKGIVIKISSNERDRLYWKNTLKFNNEIINNDNYKRIIAGINDISELTVLKNKLIENIDWYHQTVFEFDNLKFVYSLYGSDKEYDTFEQLFTEL